MDAESAHVRRLSLDKIRSQGKQMTLWKRLLISNIVNIIAVNWKHRRGRSKQQATVLVVVWSLESGQEYKRGQ